MLNVFVRTVILYLIIVILMRITGKRQIGQLELTELVTAFMISELAAGPISNNSIPIFYGILPAVILVCLEVFLSFLSLKSLKFRTLLSGRALVLVRKGKPDKEQMNKARITLEELMSAMRCSGVSCLKNVEYAFLEPNGTISIIPKAGASPPSANDMNIKVSDEGIEHPLILDGIINKRELDVICKDEAWLENKIKEAGYKGKEELFYMGVNDLWEVYFVRNEDKK